MRLHLRLLSPLCALALLVAIPCLILFDALHRLSLLTARSAPHPRDD